MVDEATAGGYLLSILFIPYVLTIALLILFITKFFAYQKHKLIIQIIFVFSAISGGVVCFYSLINSAIQILYVLPIISANKGFSNKLFSVYAPISIILACDIYYTLEYILIVGGLQPLICIKILLILLNIALLRVVIKHKSENAVSEKPDAKKQLCILKDKLDNKLITDEEYTAEREKIINSL